MRILGTILFFVTLVSSCKKGENDPILSFRSRKTRIVNTWELKSYKINSKEQTSKNISGELRIQNNGKYFYSTINNSTGFITSHSGTWDFLLKSQKFKDKERIIFTAIGIDLPFVYEIVGLKNNQLQLKSSTKFGDSTAVEEWCYETKRD